MKATVTRNSRGFEKISYKRAHDRAAVQYSIMVFQKIVREVAGVGPNATKKAPMAGFMKVPSKDRLLDEVFLLPPEMPAKSRYVLDNNQRRYISTPSFKTNGLVSSLLWIDTTSMS
ncbi:hypothetical protein SeMB42_g03151 [Synchytrium endobioticum]|uniref:Uncharacterized protein n=1 Tax=Synchytrium endobioticum TaxID=286115 RepID=A0A507D935_9FUNG|nr:hypothetical protein SeMB42_g03151 [Synchytrium endobioticum]